MPRRKTNRSAFTPREPGFFAQSELATWLGVSRNSVADIADRFGLRPLEGRFPEAEVYRKILRIDPRDDHDRDCLRRPLEGSGWLSRTTGVPASSIRSRVRNGSFDYPLGVQLSETSEGGAEPRSRRWIACVIEALADGREPPSFAQVGGEPTATPREMPGCADGSGAPNNVFARIARGNDSAAPQRAK